MSPADFDLWLQSPPNSRRPLVMGILNITPDSFSADGKVFSDDPAQTLERSVAHALAMAADGADLIDIGGESTRPGALPVLPDEQIRRVIPAIAALKARSDVTLSIDTRSSRRGGRRARRRRRGGQRRIGRP